MSRFIVRSNDELRRIQFGEKGWSEVVEAQAGVLLLLLLKRIHIHDDDKPVEMKATFQAIEGGLRVPERVLKGGGRELEESDGVEGENGVEPKRG